MFKSFIALTTMFALCSVLQAQEYTFDHTIDILSVAGPEENRAAQDIDVVHADDRYTIVFFLKRDGEVAPYRAHVDTEQQFDKASYAWESDRRVMVKLFNSQTLNEFKLKVWGKGDTTGMEVLDELE